MMPEDSKRLYVLFGRGGHRQHWADVLQQRFSISVEIWINKTWFLRALAADRLYLLTIDERPILSLLLAASRSLLFKRTFLFYLGLNRGLNSPGLKWKIKRFLFKSLKMQHLINIVSICPEGVDYMADKLSHISVVDLNFIDLEEHELPNQKRHVSSQNKRILSSFGLQTPRRGSDLLMSVFNGSAEIRSHYVFEINGVAQGISHELQERFLDVGGIIQSRWLEDDELLSKLVSSDVVWCMFSPDYDQSSGVFGHAAQLGVKSLIRSNSYLEKLANTISIPVLACDFCFESVVKVLLADIVMPSDNNRISKRQRSNWQSEWQNLLISGHS